MFESVSSHDCRLVWFEFVKEKLHVNRDSIGHTAARASSDAIIDPLWRSEVDSLCTVEAMVVALMIPTAQQHT